MKDDIFEVSSFTYIDIIDRAIQIINRDEQPFTWSDHGECCPWCAIAKAKGELDKKSGTRLSPQEAMLFIEKEIDSDDPLVFARKALEQCDVDPYSITKRQTIEILLQAKKVIIIDAPVGITTQAGLTTPPAQQAEAEQLELE